MGTTSRKASTRGSWPELSLAAIPDAAETASLAVRVRGLLFGPAEALRPLGNIREICRMGRFQLRERRLGGARGGLEAVLAPAEGNRFEIHVDPEPPGGWERLPRPIREPLRRQRLRFRVAHEMAHSFFYERGEGVPCRRLGNSRRQEEFCDRFAAEFLLPGAAVARAERSASALLGLATEYDVSLQMAARSFASQWPDALVALLVQGAGGFDRQWAAGEDGLPSRWWRQGPFGSGSADVGAELAPLVSAWGLEGGHALALPERRQLIVLGSRPAGVSRRGAVA